MSRRSNFQRVWVYLTLNLKISPFCRKKFSLPLSVQGCCGLRSWRKVRSDPRQSSVTVDYPLVSECWFLTYVGERVEDENVVPSPFLVYIYSTLCKKFFCLFSKSVQSRFAYFTSSAPTFVRLGLPSGIARTEKRVKSGVEEWEKDLGNLKV